MSKVVNNTETLKTLIGSVGKIIEAIEKEKDSLNAAFTATKSEWNDSKSLQFQSVVKSTAATLSTTTATLTASKAFLEALKTHLEDYEKVSFPTNDTK